MHVQVKTKKVNNSV